MKQEKNISLEKTRYTKNEAVIIRHGFYRGTTLRLNGVSFQEHEGKTLVYYTGVIQDGKELIVPEYSLKRPSLFSRFKKFFEEFR